MMSLNLCRTCTTGIFVCVFGICFGLPPRANAQGSPAAVVHQTTRGRSVALNANAPIYLLPDAARDPLRIAAIGSTVSVLDTEGDWCHVEFEDPGLGRRTGYVQAKLVTPPTSDAASSPGRPAPGREPSQLSAATVPAPRNDAPMKPASADAQAQPGPPGSSSVPGAIPIAPRLATAPSASITQIVPSSGTLNIAKDSPVVVLLPWSAMKWDGVLLSGAAIYTAGVELSSQGVKVGSDDHWQEAGFPAMLEGRIEKVTRKKDTTEVEIRGATALVYGAVKLRFPPGTDIMPAIQRVVLQGGSKTDAATIYRQNIYKVLAARAFAGPLQEIPLDRKLELMEFTHLTAAAESLSGVVYKSNAYLSVNVGTYGSMLNDIKFTQSGRIAYVMNDRFLKTLKAFGARVHDVPQVYGLKLSFAVQHDNFVTHNSAGVDHVDVYAPSELVRQFSDDEITSQKLIDGSIVIAGDNRIEVNLTAAAP